MTPFDTLMIFNTFLAVSRQLAIAHAEIYHYKIALLMNLSFGIAYSSIGLWSGVLFSIVHTILTIYGWYRWHHKLNK